MLDNPNLSTELAVQAVVNFENKLGRASLRLACHAAFPFFLTPDLVNLIRINFLDDEPIPWIAESDILLSSLCRPVGENLFQVEPTVRQVLLVELEETFGWFRLYELAHFLRFYVTEKPSQDEAAQDVYYWLSRAYLEPERVIEDLDRALDGLAGVSNVSDLGVLAEQIRLTQIVEITSDALEQSGSYRHPQLLAKSRVLADRLYRVAREPEVSSETGHEDETGRQEAEPAVPQPFRDRFLDGRAEGPAMVWLPGGTFTMGDDKSGRDNEKPAHQVTLGAFSIGKYPVTVGEFRRFVETKGYQTEAERKGSAYVYDGQKWVQKQATHWRNPYFPQGDDHPVVCVSWNDAVAYCQWLSELTGERYSLPTEAEWEYACRAGSATAYGYGDDERQLGDYAWYSKNARKRTHAVGKKRANHWGLYDMHGNVWEWVQDWFGDYPREPQYNPSGPESGSGRVYRGGGWYGVAVRCCSESRHRDDPENRHSDLGFRLARRV